MADVIGAIVALLAADAGVAALVENRVFGGELPDDETQHMPRRALVVQPSGGVALTAGSYAEVSSPRIDITAYGATHLEADQLRGAAEIVLIRVRRQVSARVLIHWVESAGGPFGARDPNFAWPQATQPFQVFHSLQEV